MSRVQGQRSNEIFFVTRRKIFKRFINYKNNAYNFGVVNKNGKSISGKTQNVISGLTRIIIIIDKRIEAQFRNYFVSIE